MVEFSDRYTRGSTTARDPQPEPSLRGTFAPRGDYRSAERPQRFNDDHLADFGIAEGYGNPRQRATAVRTLNELQARIGETRVSSDAAILQGLFDRFPQAGSGRSAYYAPYVRDLAALTYEMGTNYRAHGLSGPYMLDRAAKADGKIRAVPAQIDVTGEQVAAAEEISSLVHNLETLQGLHGDSLNLRQSVAHVQDSISRLHSRGNIEDLAAVHQHLGDERRIDRSFNPRPGAAPHEVARVLQVIDNPEMLSNLRNVDGVYASALTDAERTRLVRSEMQALGKLLERLPEDVGLREIQRDLVDRVSKASGSDRARIYSALTNGEISISDPSLKDQLTRASYVVPGDQLFQRYLAASVALQKNPGSELAAADLKALGKQIQSYGNYGNDVIRDMEHWRTRYKTDPVRHEQLSEFIQFVKDPANPGNVQLAQQRQPLAEDLLRKFESAVTGEARSYDSQRQLYALKQEVAAMGSQASESLVAHIDKEWRTSANQNPATRERFDRFRSLLTDAQSFQVRPMAAQVFQRFEKVQALDHSTLEYQIESQKLRDDVQKLGKYAHQDLVGVAKKDWDAYIEQRPADQRGALNERRNKFVDFLSTFKPV